jgi:hypothetical protein
MVSILLENVARSPRGEAACYFAMCSFELVWSIAAAVVMVALADSGEGDAVMRRDEAP